MHPSPLSTTPSASELVSGLHRFDLNLLLALDALLLERSVTRAAKRLFVTQPALSAALQRLRVHFDDPLLTRVGRSMILTPKAEALVEPVRETLLMMRVVLETRCSFDPQSDRRCFRLAMSDYWSLLLLPRVSRRLFLKAPGVRLEVEPVSETTLQRLQVGELDLSIAHSAYLRSVGDAPWDKLRQESILDDDFVGVVAIDHPFGAEVNIAMLSSYPHVIVRMGALPTLEDITIQQYGVAINVGVTVPTLSGMLMLVPGTRMIAVAPRRLFNLMAQVLPIRMFELPLPVHPFPEMIAWHMRSDHDPGNAWLRQIFREEGRRLRAGTSTRQTTSTLESSSIDLLA